MKLIIEGSALVDDHFSGIGQYVLGILRGLDRLNRSKERGPTVAVAIPFDRLSRFRRFRFQNIQAKLIPYPSALAPALLNSSRAPALDTLCGNGLYIFPRYLSYPLKQSPSAVVIHDLSFKLHREMVAEDNARFLDDEVKKSLAQCQRVITISQNSAREIHQHYQVPMERILFAPPAADQKFFYRRSPSEIQTVRSRYGIDSDYILSLSNLEPRKNLDTLVDAYCDLPKDVRDRFGLLLVGAVCWKSEDLVEKILTRIEQGYNIMRPASYVLDEDKPAIYSGAAAFVYPSHYEGFGMPPLEALACGTPVITSNNSSLPEVVGEVAHLINADDTEGLSKRIKWLLTRQSSETEKSIKQGPLQAETYSWEKSAQVYLDLAFKSRWTDGVRGQMLVSQSTHAPR